jgi:hypothetical protein
MNQKMLDYLYDVSQKIGDADVKLMLAMQEVSPAVRSAYFELNKHVWHLRHAIEESSTCDHCKELGLVD